MRKLLHITCLLLVSTLTGCAISDVVFSAFGDHYTGGGTTRAEKKYHYDQQIEASKMHRDWEPLQ